MDEKLSYQKELSLEICDRLVRELQENSESADGFFGGEIHKSYVDATETALEKTRTIKQKINNL